MASRNHGKDTSGMRNTREAAETVPRNDGMRLARRKGKRGYRAQAASKRRKGDACSCCNASSTVPLRYFRHNVLFCAPTAVLVSLNLEASKNVGVPRAASKHYYYRLSRDVRLQTVSQTAHSRGVPCSTLTYRKRTSTTQQKHNRTPSTLESSGQAKTTAWGNKQSNQKLWPRRHAMHTSTRRAQR